MKFEDLLATARESFDVRRVYTEPYTQDGVTVIAAASVAGGAGGGAGNDPGGQQGEGGGFGVRARPVGAYVIKDGSVRWVPAVDAGRVLGMLTCVAILMILRRRSRCRHHHHHHPKPG